VLIIGFLSFAVGTYWMTYLTRDWDFWELFWPQVFRGVGLMMAMIPINNIALGTLPAELVKNASGLFNLKRNLGGAVGLAALTTILNDRTDLHLARLHESITWAHRPALEVFDTLTARFSSYGSDAKLMALKQLNQIKHRQGVVMAFADVFLLLTLLFVGLAFLALIMRRPTQTAGRQRSERQRVCRPGACGQIRPTKASRELPSVINRRKILTHGAVATAAVAIFI
jgi:MFS transporter, DHA2 family, multidrug resistance protein